MLGLVHRGGVSNADIESFHRGRPGPRSRSEAAFLGQAVIVMGAHPGRFESVIDLAADKPGNRIDRRSAAFFDITSRLRTVLEQALRD
jgi:ABC-type nitrate/sulfonate/bicarbonate transport system ATPase subunit